MNRRQPDRLARWFFLTAVAPIAFGSAYWVTREFLPPESPIWGSAIRALPAGILLLLFVRTLPRGSWWWKAGVLGSMNVGGFFLLVYMAAQLLPSSVAVSVGSIAPLVLAALAWPLANERPTRRLLAGSAMGIIGVGLIVGMSPDAIDAWGVAATLGALVLMSFGAALSKRWDDGTPVVTTTAWQLLAGGVQLLLVAVLVEGGPPAVNSSSIAAFSYLSLIATAVAFVCWFSGLRHLTAGTVGMIGLLNPVTGVLLGTLVAGEPLSSIQRTGIGVVLCAILVGRRSRTARERPPRGGSPAETPATNAATGTLTASCGGPAEPRIRGRESAEAMILPIQQRRS